MQARRTKRVLGEVGINQVAPRPGSIKVESTDSGDTKARARAVVVTRDLKPCIRKRAPSPSLESPVKVESTCLEVKAANLNHMTNLFSQTRNGRRGDDELESKSDIVKLEAGEVAPGTEMVQEAIRKEEEQQARASSVANEDQGPEGREEKVVDEKPKPKAKKSVAFAELAHVRMFEPPTPLAVRFSNETPTRFEAAAAAGPPGGFMDSASVFDFLFANIKVESIFDSHDSFDSVEMDA